jgi:hypothetical protein
MRSTDQCFQDMSGAIFSIVTKRMIEGRFAVENRYCHKQPFVFNQHYAL